MLNIRHSATNGTTISGDETREAKAFIKSLGFVWSPSRTAWYKLKSVGQISPAGGKHRLEYYKQTLEKNGYNCEVEYVEETEEQAREKLIEIYESRVDRMDHRIENSNTKSDNFYSNASKISNMIPLGQPILIGHHSEKRHRRDLDRIDSSMRKSVEEMKKAQHYENKKNRYEIKLDELKSYDENKKAKEFDTYIFSMIKKNLKKDLGLDNLRIQFKSVNRICYVVRKGKRKFDFHFSYGLIRCNNFHGASDGLPSFHESNYEKYEDILNAVKNFI